MTTEFHVTPPVQEINYLTQLWKWYVKPKVIFYIPLKPKKWI